MPYEVRGNAVYRKDTGELVGHSNNVKKYFRTLLAIEHGYKPRKGYRAKDVLKNE